VILPMRGCKSGLNSCYISSSYFGLEEAKYIKTVFLCPSLDNFLFLKAIKTPYVPATNDEHLLRDDEQVKKES
jgi:hypothetical protein